MEREEKTIFEIDYKTAIAQGWNFQGEEAEAFMDKKAALRLANSLDSPDHDTALIKGVAGGFVMWSVGTKDLT